MNEMLTIKDAAPIIGLAEWSVRELCKAKRIRHMRVGLNSSRYFFRREWLDEYLESCVQEPENEKKQKRKRVTNLISRKPRVGKVRLSKLVDEL